MAGARIWRVVEPRGLDDTAPVRYGRPAIAPVWHEPVPVYGAGVALEPRVRALRLQWPAAEPLTMGHFVWPLGSPWPVVDAGLAEMLRRRFAGFEPRQVDIRPGRFDHHGRARMPLPDAFVAQPLRELVPVVRCGLNPSRAQLRDAAVFTADAQTLLCVDDVRDLVLDLGLTNVEFELAGGVS